MSDKLRKAKRAQLYAQLGFVAYYEAAGVRHEYEWPPVDPTPEEHVKAEHLDRLADDLFDHAEELGWEGGTDAAFGDADGK